MAVPLHNSYLTLPEILRVEQDAAAAPSPKLIAWNAALAAELGLASWREDAASRCSGARLPRFATPVALAYAGHQFGQFVPQLGDGRALLLGERIDSFGRRRDVQLKGSGRTVFSRGGDGKSPLGPVLREYLVSEAMHVLGVPTTRALAAVTTGVPVLRESASPGAVLTRIASSHVRVGTFEFLAARGDTAGLVQLTDYVVQRFGLAADIPPALAVFEHVIEVQADLIARWMALGFIHGVMNTDNMALSGETIDYGPCAFMDEFKGDKVFSSIDRFGRYAFDQQPVIGAWNLSRLASCLLMLHDDVPAFESRLETFLPTWQARYRELLAAKFGLDEVATDDAQMFEDWFALLATRELDYTSSWHDLVATLERAEACPFGEFGERWRARVTRNGRPADQARSLMAATNPVVIPRNHLIAKAIAAAEAGDFGVFEDLHRVLATPFDAALSGHEWARPPAPEERVRQTFCGT